MVHETKYLIPREAAPALAAWARKHLEPDPHGAGPHQDEYLVQSLYMDTPEWHVYRKVSSYGRSKFRVRRYGSEGWVFLERKLKRADIVRKRRTIVQLDELSGIARVPAGKWYDRRLQIRQLAPACYIQYDRMARQKMTPDGLLRLTVDHSLFFNTKVSWDWPEAGGTPLLADRVILELKYRELPALGKKLIAEFNLNPGPASKYRMALRASNLAPQVLAFDQNGTEGLADPAAKCA